MLVYVLTEEYHDYDSSDVRIVEAWTDATRAKRRAILLNRRQRSPRADFEVYPVELDAEILKIPPSSRRRGVLPQKNEVLVPVELIYARKALHPEVIRTATGVARLTRRQIVVIEAKVGPYTGEREGPQLHVSRASPRRFDRRYWQPISATSVPGPHWLLAKVDGFVDRDEFALKGE